MWTQAQFSVPAPQFQSSSPTLCSRQLREHLCHFPHISHHSVRVPHGKCLYFWNSPVSCNVWLCAAQRVKEHRRVHGICLEAIYCLLGKNSGSGRPDDGHHSAQLLSLQSPMKINISRKTKIKSLSNLPSHSRKIFHISMHKVSH